MGIAFEIYDPAMCCATGVCGPTSDTKLSQFAADLDWLRRQGVTVRRYNLSQEPGVFAGHAVVREALERDGENALPVIFVDGVEVSRSCYPTRALLAGWAGIGKALNGSVAAPRVSAGSCCGQGAEEQDPNGSTGCC
ncbi:MAG TPA: arsenite efflux transporter metallochaperone ArsD [Acidiferrobacter sp.]|nr:arsenite efflux transporter metallochaperone ArsD [Acidiferrobacter sp.]